MLKGKYLKTSRQQNSLYFGVSSLAGMNVLARANVNSRVPHWYLERKIETCTNQSELSQFLYDQSDGTQNQLWFGAQTFPRLAPVTWFHQVLIGLLHWPFGAIVTGWVITVVMQVKNFNQKFLSKFSSNMFEQGPTFSHNNAGSKIVWEPFEKGFESAIVRTSSYHHMIFIMVFNWFWYDIFYWSHRYLFCSLCVKKGKKNNN